MTLLVLCFAWLKGEDRAKTLAALQRYAPEIIVAATQWDVPPRLLASAIYADRRMYYNFLDHSLDVKLAKTGRDNSIGIAQIRVSNGLWICSVLLELNNPYFIPMDAPVTCSTERDSIIHYLSQPQANLAFAAVYSAMILKRWRDAGYDIITRPEIFATLYNLGPYRKDGSERVPHSDPVGTEFGYVAKDFYDSGLLLNYFPRNQ